MQVPVDASQNDIIGTQPVLSAESHSQPTPVAESQAGSTGVGSTGVGPTACPEFEPLVPIDS